MEENKDSLASELYNYCTEQEKEILKKHISNLSNIAKPNII